AAGLLARTVDAVRPRLEAPPTSPIRNGTMDPTGNATKPGPTHDASVPSIDAPTPTYDAALRRLATDRNIPPTQTLPTMTPTPTAIASPTRSNPRLVDSPWESAAP